MSAVRPEYFVCIVKSNSIYSLLVSFDSYDIPRYAKIADPDFAHDTIGW